MNYFFVFQRYDSMCQLSIELSLSSVFTVVRNSRILFYSNTTCLGILVYKYLLWTIRAEQFDPRLQKMETHYKTSNGHQRALVPWFLKKKTSVVMSLLVK